MYKAARETKKDKKTKTKSIIWSVFLDFVTRVNGALHHSILAFFELRTQMKRRLPFFILSVNNASGGVIEYNICR